MRKKLSTGLKTNNHCSLTSLDKNYIKVDTPLLADVYVRRGTKK